MSKQTVLDNAKKLYTTINEVIRALKNGVFPYKDGFQTEPKSELQKNLDSYIAERTKLRKQRLGKIAKREKMINPDLFKRILSN